MVRILKCLQNIRMLSKSQSTVAKPLIAAASNQKIFSDKLAAASNQKVILEILRGWFEINFVYVFYHFFSINSPIFLKNPQR